MHAGDSTSGLKRRITPSSLMLRLLIIGAAIRVSTEDDISSYDDCVFNYVGKIKYASPTSCDVYEDYVQGYEFTASANMARAAAKKFMSDVDESTSAYGDDSSCFYVKMASGNTRNMYLAEVSVDGNIFWIKQCSDTEYAV